MPEPSAAQVALVGAVTEIESYVAAAGWDRGITIFALVPTVTILENEPNLPAEMAAEMRGFVAADPGHLTSIPQDLSDSSQDLSTLLAGLVWPPAVVGMALTAERIVLPQAAEDEAPQDAAARDEFLLNHPARQDVRLAVGVLRSGESWCAIRMRAHDSDDAVAGGRDLAPDLVAAALSTFE
ncbi:MAG: PPA1309 family protein [Buchananella hordeovulneris]|nr:PPA1309 family protein [Buchananella hordeovulneris]